MYLKNGKYILRESKIKTIFVGMLMILVSLFAVPVTPTSTTNNNASADYVDASDGYVIVMDFTITDGGDITLAGTTLSAGHSIEANGWNGVWTNLKYIDAVGGDDWNASADTIFDDDDGDDNFNSSHGDSVLAGVTPEDGTEKTGNGVRSGTWTTLKTYNGGADAWEPGSDSIVHDVDNNDVYLDQLNAITFQNDGTAINSDFSSVLLWAEQGDTSGLQIDEDTIIGEATYDTTDSWDLSGLTQDIGSSNLRFYVTVNISAEPENAHTIIFKVPAKSDGDSDGSYDAVDEGIFLAGNQSLSAITNENTITIDTSTPDSTVSIPVNGAYYNDLDTINSNISGTASDSPAGIDHVNITIYNSTDGTYWTGTAWQAGVAWMQTNGTTTWYNDSAVPSWTTGNVYLVNSTAVDTVGHVQSSADSNSFTYDSADPSAPIYTTSEDQWFSSNPTLDINFSDGVELDSAEYKIDNDGSYTDIDTDISGESYDTNWEMSSADWNGMSDGIHYLYFRITDDAGNVYETADNDSGFKLKKDVNEPDSGIEMPVDGAYYNESDAIATSITGNATDDGSGVDHVNITLYNSTDGTYWTGTAWQAEVAWLSTTGTTSWSYETLPTWVHDTVYTVNSTAVDSLGNTESTPDSNSFTYDTTDPGFTTGDFEEAQWYTSNPSFDINFHDAIALYSAEYKVDSGDDYKYINSSEITGTQYNTNWQMDASLWSGLENGTHYLYIRITDDAGNQYESASDEAAFEFKKDTNLPSSSISLPEDGVYYTTGSSIDTNITGSAIDTTSDIDHVNITIYNSSGNTYWNGEDWQAAVAWMQTNGTTTWYNDSAVPSWYNGTTYLVNATAVDIAGNVQATTTSHSFTYDTVQPSTIITLPVDGAYYNATDDINSNITGTAEDVGPSDVDHVNITVYNSSGGTYWTGTVWQEGVAWLEATGTTSWHYDSDFPTWTSGNVYTVNSSATDSAGNIESTDSNSFTYDTVNPTRPSYNTAENQWFNSNPTLDIDFSDGIALQKAEYKVDSGGEYSTIASGIEGSSNDSDWEMEASDWSAASEGSHVLYFRITDDAGNVYLTEDDEGEGPLGEAEGFSFKKDTVKPDSTITVPSTGSYYNAADTIASNITGSASDATSGISNVNITINNATDGTFWTGTEWQEGIAWLSTTGTESWYYDTDYPTWVSGKMYYVNSTAIDNASNIDDTPDSESFTYDTAKPDSTITSPADGAELETLTSISGTAVDSGPSDISYVNITLYNSTDGTYWTGSTWQAEVAWLTTSGTTSWSKSSDLPTFIDGKSYIVNSTAVDVAGNVEESADSNSFTMDDTAPSVSQVIIFDATASSLTLVKDGDAVRVNATITDSGLGDGDTSYLKADLSGFGLGTAVEATSYSSNIAWWNVTVGTCDPADGTITVTINATDPAGNYNNTESDTITSDNTAPTISYSVLDADNDGTTNTYIDVLFNEAMDTTSFDASDFEISNALVDVESVQSSASTRVTLKLDTTLPTGDSPKVYMNGSMTDAVGNTMPKVTNATIWTYRISLRQGWNMVSIPGYVSDVAIATLLSDISDNVNTVFGYDPDNGWSSWSPAGGGSLTVLHAGKGYWFKMDEADILTGNYNLTYSSGGSAPSPPSQMLTGPGWNLIGQYQPYNQTSNTNGALASLNSVLSSSGEILYQYTVSGGFVNIYDNGDYNMEPGVGYWLWISDETTNAGYAPN